MRCWIAVLLALLLARTAAAERLSFDSGPGASTPSLAADPNRGLILTWQTRDGDSYSLNYALLSADGREVRRGVIASGHDWFVNAADFPSLAVLDNNDWVSFWLQRSAPGSDAYDIQLVRSSNGGGRWGAPLTPHELGMDSQHGFVSLVSLPKGLLQVLWLDGGNVTGSRQHGHHELESPMGLRSVLLNRSGRMIEPQLLDGRTCSCCQTDAVAIGDEVFAVYRDRSASEVRDIALIKRSVGGSWSKPRRLHADGWKTTACPVNGPAIAASGEQTLSVWPTLATSPMAVRYQLRKGGKVRVDALLEQGEAVLGRVDVSAAADGGFAISWLGAGAKGMALKLAEVDAQGVILSIREIALLAADRDIGNPRLLWYRNAHYLAWTESAGGSGSRIALERIDP